MAYKATSLVVFFSVCHGQHARADFEDVTQIGKAFPKAFVPTLHMPRLSGFMLVNRAHAVEQANRDAATLSNQFDSALRLQETPIKKQSEELKELVQHLRARVQPMPQADAKDAQYRVGFGILMLLMLSVGLVASIGIAVIQQHLARVQQALESMMGSQISTPQRNFLSEAKVRGSVASDNKTKQKWREGHGRCPKPSLAAMASASSSSSPTVGSKSSVEDEDESTVVSISNPKTGQSVTLVGTDHGEEKSKQQVRRLIETVQPNAVMIEIDPSRLEDLGFDSADEIRVARVTDSEDIELPMSASQTMDTHQNAFVGAISKAVELLLSGCVDMMRNDMEAELGRVPERPELGCELLQAVRSAEDCTVCDTVILGDRSLVASIERFAELVRESEDLCSNEEFSELELKVRQELLQQKGEDGNDTYKLDEVEVETALAETINGNLQYQERLASIIELEKPDFTQAFVKERDYVMSESIRREFERRPEVKTVVGVVGRDHLPGMERHFKTVFADAPAPLEQDIAAAATK